MKRMDTPVTKWYGAGNESNVYRERLVCNLVGVGENKLQLDGKVCLENKM